MAPNVRNRGKATSHKSRSTAKEQNKGNGRPARNAASIGTVNPDDAPPLVPLELQQLLLNIFKNSFFRSEPEEFRSTLQEVKQHLYNRDFQKAFGNERYLEAYALRWSPSRALGYLDIFYTVSQHLRRRNQVVSPEDLKPSSAVATNHEYRIACLGGGAGAEVVALAGLCKLLGHQLTPSEVVPHGSDGAPVPDEQREESSGSTDTSTGIKVSVTALDIADWKRVLLKLQEAVTSPPALSLYASAAARASNRQLLSNDQFYLSFVQKDLLELPQEELPDLLHDASLVTLMFTLNELYSASIGKATKLLLNIGSAVRVGTLLLVVDSPGSYSTVSIGRDTGAAGNTPASEKKYPMQWLLDRTLLESPSGADSSGSPSSTWEKLESDDSRWFRLPEGLKYPIDLENMRYQLHLYRRT